MGWKIHDITAPIAKARVQEALGAGGTIAASANGSGIAGEQARVITSAGQRAPARPSISTDEAKLNKQRILAAYWQANGIPLPEAEYVFHLGRKWPFDFAWIPQKLALEVEGGVFNRKAHGSITGILRDIEKYNQATLDGWRVLRVIPDDLLTLNTCRMIRHALHLT